MLLSGNSIIMGFILFNPCIGSLTLVELSQFNLQVCGLCISPLEFSFFLWLLSNNKNLTRDNLEKRKQVHDKTCLYCGELESTFHLFFDCVVARQMWCRISSVVGRVIETSFESIGICWLSNYRFLNVNIISSAALWSFWKLRNDLCFQNKMCRNMEGLLLRVVSLA
jgi:hypothetical protein